MILSTLLGKQREKDRIKMLGPRRRNARATSHSVSYHMGSIRRLPDRVNGDVVLSARTETAFARDDRLARHAKMSAQETRHLVLRDHAHCDQVMVGLVHAHDLRDDVRFSEARYIVFCSGVQQVLRRSEQQGGG